MYNPPVIAVVDDEEAIRDALSDLLLVMGFSCQAFERAEAFLAANEPGSFDCLITDIRMPGMNGLEMLQHLQAAGSTLPVIVVTSMADPATQARALESGAVAYLTKPVTDEVLLQSLRIALPGREVPPDNEERPSDT